MYCKQLIISYFNSFITITTIHHVTWLFSKVWCSTCYHINLIPLIFWHKYRVCCISLYYYNIRCIYAVIVMYRIVLHSVWCVKSCTHIRRIKIKIQCGTSTQAFFLCRTSPNYATARICCAGKIMYAYI